MKKLISILAVFSLLMAMTFPVFAEDIITEEDVNTENDLVFGMHDAQKRLDMIVALIGLYQNANTQENRENLLARLERVGVSRLDGPELAGYLEMEGISLSRPESLIDTTLPSVESTDFVEWFVSDMSGAFSYYYPELSMNYDIYFIMASPLETDSCLVRQSVSVSNDSAFDIISDGLDWGAQAILSFVADECGYTVIYTAFDLITTLVSGAGSVEITELSVGSWTLNWTTYSSFAYLYVRPSGSQADYEFSMGGSKVIVDYVYTQYVKAYDENGKLDGEYVVLRGSDVEFMRPSFANLKKAVDAYRNQTIEYNIISYIDLQFFEDDPSAKETARIFPAAWRVDPNDIYWENEDEITS